MNRIGKFHKVSFEQFKGDWQDTFGELPEEELRGIYEGVRLPTRATSGSAGYDFFTPIALSLGPGETVKVPTGIRAEIDEGWVLQIYRRSGLGFKYRLQLDNTVGIIDADYCRAENQGHIFIKITNDSLKQNTLTVKKGDAFAQGIIMSYFLTEDDDASALRSGGLGSTDRV